MAPLADESAALVVTAPPYPTIAMWDRHFSALDPAVEHALAAGRIEKRLADHGAFTVESERAGRRLKHENRPHRIPVMTNRETELFLSPLIDVAADGDDAYRVFHEDAPTPGKPG